MRKLTSAFGINLALIAIMTVLQFFQNKYFVLYLGVDELGLVRLMTQMVLYLSIIEAGLATASAYALYDPMAKGDTERSGHLFHSIAKLYRRIIVTCFVIGLAMTAVLPFFLKGIPFSLTVASYWWVYLVGSCFRYLQVKYIAVLTAGQHKYAVTFIPSVSQLITRSLGLFAIMAFHSLTLFVVVSLVGAAFEVAISRWIFFRHYAELPKVDFDGKVDPVLTTSMKQLFWHTSAGVVVFAAETAVIAAVTDLRTVGIYAAYLFVINGLMQVMRSVASLMRPGIGRLNSTLPIPEVFSRFKAYNTFFVVIAAVVSTTTFFLYPSFVTLWLGPSFVLSTVATILICFNLAVRLYRTNLEAFKATSGYYSDVHLPIIEAVLNLGLAIALGSIYGLPGVLVATSITSILVVLGEKTRLLYVTYFQSTNVQYFRDHAVWILDSVAIVAIAWVLVHSTDITVHSWLGFAGATVALAAALTAAGMGILLLNRPSREPFLSILAKTTAQSS